MSERRSDTICAVVVRPDHHYCDDLVIDHLVEVLDKVSKSVVRFVATATGNSVNWVPFVALAKVVRLFVASLHIQPIHPKNVFD